MTSKIVTKGRSHQIAGSRRAEYVMHFVACSARRLLPFAVSNEVGSSSRFSLG